MTVIWTKDGIVDDDPWIAGDAEQGPKLLPLAGALDHAQDNAPFGVVLQPADDVLALAPILDRVAIVALSFPAFSDGRAFSQAALLRAAGWATAANCGQWARCCSTRCR